MTIGTTDIFLLVIIVSALVVGFFWGAARSLMLAGGLAAGVPGRRLPEAGAGCLPGPAVGRTSRPAFSEMAAFGLIYMCLLLRGSGAHRGPHPGQPATSPAIQVLDDLAGAAVRGLRGRARRRRR